MSADGNMFLTHDELAEMTHKKRHSAQRRALNALGIDCKVRPDGSLLVLRDHVAKVMGGAPKVSRASHAEPNWNARKHA